MAAPAEPPQADMPTQTATVGRLGEASSDVLRAPLVLEYPFTRTTGEVIGAFLTGLKQRVILGIRRGDGTVLCPPSEYDPTTAEPLTETVQVGERGEVVTWAWNGEPRPQQPFDGPFAWALIRLDGADTTMVHGVLAGSAAEVRTGMRVRAVWRDDRQGHIADIAGFVADSAADNPADTTAEAQR